MRCEITTASRGPEAAEAASTSTAAPTSSEGGREAREGLNYAAICTDAIVSQICRVTARVGAAISGGAADLHSGRLARRNVGLRVTGQTA